MTCAPPAYNVYPNQTTDSTAGILAAINACPSGRAVYLPAGTYRIGGTIFLKSRVSLRGAGVGSTVLSCSAMSSVQIGASILSKAPRFNIRGGVAKGEDRLVLATRPPASCQVGGLILVDEFADYDLTWHRSGLDPRVHSFLARITAVDGNTITFTPPNIYTFSEVLAPHSEILEQGERSFVGRR